MSFATLSAFALTCLVIELTPGPNMAYLAVLSASKGRRAGFIAVLGIALGLMIAGLGAALGLAAVIANSAFLYQALRWGGVAYLFWLAWDGWRSAVETSPATVPGGELDSTLFKRGLITNLLNPKAAIFFITVLPAFISADQPSILLQNTVLTVVYIAIATLIHVGIVTVAGAARPLLEDVERSRKIRQILSLALAGIAIWFAWQTRS